MRTIQAALLVLVSVLGMGASLWACPPHPVSPPPDATDAAWAATDASTAPPAEDAPTGAVDGALGPVSVDDGGVVEDPLELAKYPQCTKMCANLKKLGCPEAARVAGGQTCFKVCAHAEASGHFDIKPACVAAANSVGAAKACGTVRCLK